jgi:hypothetical protein
LLAPQPNAKRINEITVGTGVPTFPTLCIYLHAWLERFFAAFWHFCRASVQFSPAIPPDYSKILKTKKLYYSKIFDFLISQFLKTFATKKPALLPVKPASRFALVD